MAADDEGEGASAHKVSPLHSAHVALGAKMVPFGGWEMPLSYPWGTVAEHRACRETAVAFDVSHLGTVRVEGASAFDHLQSSLSNDLRRISTGESPTTCAIRSMCRSIANRLWGAPKPRKAPWGGALVATALARIRTFGQ